MPFITFIYSYRNCDSPCNCDCCGSEINYGKYCTNNMSDDYEKIYVEIKEILMKKNNYIDIGIISISSYNFKSPDLNQEIRLFNFYRDYNGDEYWFGNKI